jgi:membrane protease YdiL (CAAX protease family)
MNDVNRPATYQEEVARYTKKDGLRALLFMGYIGLVVTAFFALAPVFNLWDEYGATFAGQLVFMGMVLILFLLPLLVFVKKRGQNLRSLGLHLLNWKKALLAGLFIAAVILMVHSGVLPGLLAGWELHTGLTLVWIIVSALIMAFWEDIVFIGYSQTRIYGLIKSDVLAVLLVAFIFAAIHYPNLILSTILSGEGFGSAFWGAFAFGTVFRMVLHIMMNMIFRRFRSIIPVTLFHFSWNIALGGRLWVDAGDGGFNQAISVGIIVFVVFSICLYWPFLKKLINKRKAAR